MNFLKEDSTDEPSRGGWANRTGRHVVNAGALNPKIGGISRAPWEREAREPEGTALSRCGSTVSRVDPVVPLR